MKIPKSLGIYTLIIGLPHPIRRKIGGLGSQDFPAGTYTYTGSALGKSSNLEARITRHLKTEKKKHWHIDYLLDAEDAPVKALAYAETPLKRECEVARKIEQLPAVKSPIRGFGSSDCRGGCCTHLHYFRNLSLEETILQVADVYSAIFDGFQLIRV